MHKKHETSPKIGLLTEGDNSIKGSGRNFVSGLVVKNKKVIVDDILSEKETVYRVRPRPIKSHAMFREWMTKEQIEAVAYEKSSHWIEGGAGNLGGEFQKKRFLLIDVINNVLLYFYPKIQ